MQTLKLVCNLLKEVRSATLDTCMREFGIKPPATDYPASRTGASGTEFLLNKPLQRDMSELAQTAGSTLSARRLPEKENLVPSVLKKLCSGYRHLDQLLKIAEEGVEVRLLKKPLIRHVRPPNHGAARARINILRKNIRKEQDAWRCLVLDAGLIEQWPELIVSPFGVVDKGNEGASTSGRTIHDLSYPEGETVNDYTGQANITKPDFVHCDAVATDILRVKREHPNTEIEVMAGDVSSAFRNISIHSNSVFLFAGRIEEENVIVIELSAPFGWTRSPGFYEIVGGAISHVHGSQYNAVNPTGFFNYHWLSWVLKQ
ncbi:hypothetical protein PHMEG_00021866 [Phytophthora megakarya]|uniref:Secreted protein n=1 Tax=Phytophthora megakarya TaxID=4795 RepID=A0A225VKT8_9STRA|nr:hypothetical protein PHMEG_00021866 [Phytophthora megakarya]